MINLNETITIKWTTRNKNYYENLGYPYSGIGQSLDVMIKDIPENSSIRVPVTCDCDDCQKRTFTPIKNYNRLIKEHGLYRCKDCAFKLSMKERDGKSHKRLYSVFLKKCEEHNCIPITTYEDFGGCKSFVKYICPIHGETKSFMGNVVNNNAWCYKCGKMHMAEKLSLGCDEVIQEIENKNSNILLNPEDYVNSSTRNLNVICGSCGNAFITSLASIRAGSGHCPDCGVKLCGESRRISKEDIVELATIDNRLMVKNIDDFIGMNEPLLFYCSDCGEPFYQTPHNYLKRGFQRCKKCIPASYGEESIMSFLDNHHIGYIFQKRYDDCIDIKPLPFDFYLPKYNLLIEYDGPQHFYPVDYYGGEEKFKIRKKHDEIKNNYAKNNGIDLIRIPYWDKENIETILINKLNLY